MKENKNEINKLDDDSVEQVTGGRIDEGYYGEQKSYTFWCEKCQTQGVRDYKPRVCPLCGNPNISVSIYWG